MTLLMPTLYGFALVLFRTAGLCMTVPVLGSRAVPVRIRLSVAVFCAFAVFMGAGGPPVAMPEGFPSLAGAAALETVFGAIAGLSVKIVLDAAVAAGQAAAMSMGLGFGALVDPTSGAESAAVGQVLSTLALAMAVAMGVHREALLWLTTSVQDFPVGGALPLSQLLAHLIRQALGSVALAVRVAYPILVAVTLGHVTLALVSRSAQQLNISSVGFSIAILAGGGALFLVAPDAARIIGAATLQAFPRG